ncbi:MAG: ArnT family glycosyltransferase [Elusimicrobiota bacterium]
MFPYAAAFIVAASAWAWGRRLRPLFRVPLEEWEAAGLAFLLGFGVLGYGIFALGWSGVLEPWWLWLWAGTPALLHAVSRPVGVSRLRIAAAGGWKAWSALPAFEKVLATVSAACLGLYFLAAGAPPVTPDVVSYHLALPKIYLQQGRISFIPHINSSEWPALLNMLFMPALSAGAPQAAQILHGFLGLLLVLWTHRVGRRYGNSWIAWTAVALLVTTPVYKILAVSALVDLAAGLYGSAALYAFWRWTETRRNPWLFLTGALAGLMGAVKLTGVLWLGVLGILWLAWRDWRGEKWRPVLTEAAIFLGPFVCLMLPWLIRSWWDTGNPLWPNLYGVFGGKYWDAAQAERWARLGSGENLGGSWWGESVLIKAKGLIFPEGGAAVFRGPFIAAFAAALAWRRGKLLPKRPRGFLAAVSLYLAVYLVLLPESLRYLTPILPLMALGLAAGLHDLYRKGGAARWAACGLIVLMAAFRFPGREDRLAEKARVVLGLMPQEEYLTRSLDVYPASRLINAALGPGDRVLLLNNRKGFYIDRDYVWGNPADQAYVHYGGLRNLEDLLDRWRAKGITHVLIEGEQIAWPADGWAVVGEFFRAASRAGSAGGYHLYRLPT